MAKIELVSGPDGNGLYTARVRGVGISFGRVKEPAAWRTGDQQLYHSMRYWWLKHGDHRGKIFILREQPREGQELDLNNVVATLNEDAIQI